MTWHVHPDVILSLALLEIGYLFALRVVGRPRGLRPTQAQVMLFSAGVLVLYIGGGTPLHDLSEERLFSAHMVQHMLFTLVAPPLLLLGTPGWLVSAALQREWIFRVARFLTLPLIAFVLFNGLTLVTHYPVVVDMALRVHWFHFAVHVALVATALLMWWPALSPSAELPRLGPMPQMIYLFAQSFVPTVLASFITFSDSVWYEFYANAPRTWGISASDDQLLAGLIMKLIGGVIIWTVIAAQFFRWVARENRASLGKELSWEEVQTELDRMGLTSPRPR